MFFINYNTSLACLSLVCSGLEYNGIQMEKANLGNVIKQCMHFFFFLHIPTTWHLLIFNLLILLCAADITTCTEFPQKVANITAHALQT